MISWGQYQLSSYDTDDDYQHTKIADDCQTLSPVQKYFLAWSFSQAKVTDKTHIPGPVLMHLDPKF